MIFSTPLFHNGVWKSKSESQNITLFIFGDENDMVVDMDYVRHVMSNAENLFAIAAKHAVKSEYKADILGEGGIVPSNVTVEDKKTIYVWFSFSNSWRMVGVKMLEGKIVDTYCDSP